jgi:hypothetical protein
MFYETQKPESDEEIRLAERVEVFRLTAQGILVGSFILLGFQIYCQYAIAWLSRPAPSRYVHIFSITLMVLTILWAAPIAFPSNDLWAQPTRLLWRLGKKKLAIASALLAIAIAGDIYVAMRVEKRSYSLAICLATLTLALIGMVWLALLRYFKHRPGIH